ncbi:MAG: GGDEF domain-containing protein [Treponema sp.]|nr:GGDEF domain-containing protein [Candidatus Treponema caballi]
MKNRIAVFASGWASQILSQYFEGFSAALKGSVTDTYLFLCYPSWASTPEDRNGEFNILRLPHLEDFTAAVIFSNGLEFNDQIDYIVNECRKAGIPAISLGIKFDGLYYVGVDNVTGMRALCEHLADEHGITHPFFLAGSKENADSKLRLDVLKEVMKEHGNAFDDSQVFYTNWENARTIAFINEWCESGKELPDAFVCANDGLAMNTCLALQEHGYSIPDDVFVTGFDNLFDAQVYAPSISSVNQNYAVLGSETAKLILDVASGRPREMELIIPSRFVISESCCSSKTKEIDILRRKLCRDHYMQKNADTQLDRKLNYLERMLLTGRKYEDIHENLKAALDYEFKYEGNSFHLALNPGYEMSIYDSNVTLDSDGYSSTMHAAISMENGRISEVRDFSSRELIPDHREDDKEHLYVFLPIHSQQETYGYFIMTDCYAEIDGHFLSRYQQRLNIAFERYRQKLNLDELNRQLTEITRIDSLTHVKNRMAYDAMARDMLFSMRKIPDFHFAIAMFDINNLKTINDVMGHKAGDVYIINCSRLICHTFKQSPVFRIGGDEFLALLTNEDYINRNVLLETMKVQMEQLKTADVPDTEKISIASGMAEFIPEKDRTVEDIFKRADTDMYENKVSMKGEDAR